MHHQLLGNPRGEPLKHTYLGPGFTEDEAKTYLDSVGAVYTRLEEPALLEKAVDLICDQQVLGWYQGRMEWGPRALGNRSILGDPRNPEMRDTINLKIKFRESFRPFAPSVLREHVGEWF